MFFDVLRRHETSFRGDKDFSWLDYAEDPITALK
eukprot:SAG11_NODE_35443_length_266_cov_1.233533_1_plen_33_part_10